MALGSQTVGDVGLHQLLDRRTERLAEQVGLRRSRDLFESGQECHSLVGHRGGLNWPGFDGADG